MPERALYLLLNSISSVPNIWESDPFLGTQNKHKLYDDNTHVHMSVWDNKRHSVSSYFRQRSWRKGVLCWLVSQLWWWCHPSLRKKQKLKRRKFLLRSRSEITRMHRQSSCVEREEKVNLNFERNLSCYLTMRVPFDHEITKSTHVIQVLTTDSIRVVYSLLRRMWRWFDEWKERVRF